MIFVDANVIVAHFAKSHEHHKASSAFLDEVLKNRQHLAFSPQIGGEAFIAATSKRFFKVPATPDEFIRLLEKFRNTGFVSVVSPGERAMDIALQTAKEKSVTSAHIFDLIIYGTMLEHGITRIATINVKHFRNLKGIEVIQVA